MIKRLVKQFIEWAVASLGRTAAGRYAERQLIEGAMQRTRHATHNGVTLTFCVPNPLNRYRADSFATKEPETLKWIDGIASGSVLWDVGANVGLYSCYAAKRRECRVFAFEPSVFNLELLARNIHLNGMGSRVTIVPLPLSERVSVAELNMSSTEWGGALSTFGQSFGQDGTPLKTIFRFSTVGIGMEDAVRMLGIPTPDYIKLDVDGLEHLILRGGADVLESVKGVLIEINEDFPAQIAGSSQCLTAAGLEFVEKRHAEVDEHSPAARSYNQIWRRSAGR